MTINLKWLLPIVLPFAMLFTFKILFATVSVSTTGTELGAVIALFSGIIGGLGGIIIAALNPLEDLKITVGKDKEK